MMDALLLGVRDTVRNAGLRYGVRECEVMVEGHPPPRCGNYFLAVHQGGVNNRGVENLDEFYGFNLTLTARISIPLDRVGDQELARKTAEGNGFNRRCSALVGLLHKSWSVVQAANGMLLAMLPDADQVYGFCESPVFRGMEAPRFVTGEWFSADPDARDVGLVSQLSFDDVRRLQAIGNFT